MALRPRTVIATASTVEAKRLTSANTFDLAVVDVHLCDARTGGENGIEFVRHLKKESPTLPVVVITGWRVGAVVDDAYQAGAIKTYEKPFEWMQIITDLERGPMAAEFPARPPTVTEWKRDYVARTLNASGINITRAANTMGVKRTSLQRLASKLGLPRTRVPPRSDDDKA